MRVVPVVIGSLLVIVALAAVFAGAFMADIGDVCESARCDDSDALFMGAIGQGTRTAGWLLGLAGIGVLVAGMLATRPEQVDGVPDATNA